MSTNIGTGTTVTFGTSGFSFDLLNVNWDGIERVVINTSHMGTTDAHTFMPGKLPDNGEIQIEGAFIGNLDPPIDGATETITVDVAGAGAGHRWAASAFMRNFSLGIPLEEKMTFTATLKVSGAITIS